MSFEAWLFFVLVWALACLPLGPNALNCVALSVDAGFRRSLWAVVGILAAALCFKASVILGFAAILSAKAGLFSIIKLCGAAYLVWMGITMWRKGAGTVVGGEALFHTPLDTARKAYLISMTNPKAILSYSAVFSQFVTPGARFGDQLMVLVPTALLITAAIYVGYCAIGSGLSGFIRSTPRRRLFNRGVGAFYMIAGGTLAVAETDGMIRGRGA